MSVSSLILFIRRNTNKGNDVSIMKNTDSLLLYFKMISVTYETTLVCTI